MLQLSEPTAEQRLTVADRIRHAAVLAAVAEDRGRLLDALTDLMVALQGDAVDVRSMDQLYPEAS